MFLPFWLQEVERPDTLTLPETRSAVWWDTKTHSHCPSRDDIFVFWFFLIFKLLFKWCTISTCKLEVACKSLSWFNFSICLCLESGWQWLDQQHLHLPCLWDGHQLLHRWHHQPQLSTTKGGRPRRRRYVKQTHPSPRCLLLCGVSLQYAC